jgi:hypothetical protein
VRDTAEPKPLKVAKFIVRESQKAANDVPSAIGTKAGAACYIDGVPSSVDNSHHHFVVLGAIKD